MDFALADPYGRGPSVAAVLLVRMLFELRDWDAAGRPTDRALPVWAGVCDLVFRFRQTGPYAPPDPRSRQRAARRVVFRGVNRVCWLLLRAVSPLEGYRPLSELTLREDYALPEFLLSSADQGPAYRAVRLSWVRRLFETLRWLYLRLDEVQNIPSISEASIRPGVEAAIADLDR